MRRWAGFAAGVAVGSVVLFALLGRGPFTATAQAQYLSRFQNVDVDFETTGSVSTLTFFDRDSGDTYIYIASGSGKFQFAQKLSIQALGGPIAANLGSNSSKIPELQTGIE